MRSFESEWAKAFEQAEIAPSAQLWLNLGSALANSDANKWRRGVMFYRLLAAASVVIAMTLGIMLYMQNLQHTPPKDITEAGEPMMPVPESKEAPAITEKLLSDQQQDEEAVKKNEVTTIKEDQPQVDRETYSSENLFTVTATDDQKNDPISSQEKVTGQQNIHSQDVGLVITQTEARLVALEGSNFRLNTNIHLYNVPVISSNSKKGGVNSPVWAGLGFSSGSFNPNVGRNSNVDAVQANFSAEMGLQDTNSIRAVTQNQQDFNPGFSYGISMNGGWYISPRWMLQSGLQFRAARSSTQTGVLIRNKETQESFALNALDQRDFGTSNIEALTSDLDLTNNYQFVSVPVKIGYLLLNNKFQLGLNTGFSTEIFLKNTVSEANNLIESFEQQPDNSSFRRTYFSGILGIEAGYNFLDNYSFIIEPNYRHSLTSFTTQGSNVASRPSGFAVNLGFRYNF